MGNCQTTEAATVVVHHPRNGKVEKMYWSISANELMDSNPGHYVALVINPSNNNGQPVKNHLKLLRPHDTMHIGHVYRLISFEDVVKEFTLKKSAKVGRLLKESRVLGVDNAQMERDDQTGGGSGGRGRHHGGGGQWRPALQSIAEF